jgi:riboflavin synthase alpha subunit
MFTGIVQTIGAVDFVERRQNGLYLAVKPLVRLRQIALGSSVAVNGVCLTVVKKKESTWWFDVVLETFKRTTLGSLKKGDTVNIELSLRMGDEVGGHFVLGHVDGVGVIKSLSHKVSENVLSVEVPKKLMRYIAEKGSVAVDGVSLTIAAVRGNSFTVALVPYTLRHTTLGKLKKGERVNIEVDIAARYLERLSG